MTTYTDLRAYYRTHRTALCALERVSVAVEVLDLRDRFGAVDALIRPVHGRGTQWVSAARLSPLEDPVLTAPT